MSGPMLRHELEEVQIADNSLTITEQYARIIVLYPKRLTAVSWTFMLICTAIVFLSGSFEIVETDAKDWIVPSSLASEVSDSLEAARKLTEINIGSNLGLRSELTNYFGINMIFEWKNQNRKEMFLNPKNLQLICQFETDITGVLEYNKYCLTDKAEGIETNCSELLTDIVPYFYPDKGDRLSCPLLSEQSFLETMSTTGKFGSSAFSGYFFDRNLNPPESFVTYITRSSVFLAGPLGADTLPSGNIYNNVDDGSGATEQFEAYESFLKGEFETRVFKKYRFDKNAGFFRSAYLDSRISLSDDVQMRYESIFFRDIAFFGTVQSDQILVAAAALIVLTLMFIHTRSWFMAISGIFTIGISFPVAMFIYSKIAGIEYFTTVNVISIFLILGVGADNIFVVFDAWKQSEVLWIGLRGFKTKQEALEKNIYKTGNADLEVEIARMSYTFRRSAASVFNTSFTTAVAFVSTAFSPVVPVSAFGIFSGIAILVNFLLVCTVVPVLTRMHNMYFVNNSKDKCHCFSSNTIESVREEPPRDHEKSVSIPNPSTPEVLEEKAQGIEKTIFSQIYVPFMLKRIYGLRISAILSVLVLSICCVLMGIYSFKLQPPLTQEEQFQPEHMFHGFLQDYIDLFAGGAATEFMTVEMFWGIEKIDREGFDKFKPLGYRGKPLFEPGFNLSLESSQQHIIESCNIIDNYECVNRETLEVPKGCIEDFLAFANETKCVIKNFVSWHNEKYPNDISVLKLGEIDYSLWMQRLHEFVEATDSFDVIGIIDGEVKFVVISYVSTMKLYQPSGVKEKYFEVLDQLAAEISDRAPAGMQSVWQTSFDLQWITLELGIIKGMYNGLLISFPSAYLVLILSTMNIILATFAIISIISIVLSVLGTVYLLGWSLGVAESISAVLVIGLAVDYTIHLGHMYQVAEREGLKARKDKFQFSAERMGPTVLAGALTTIGSSAVMFACQLTVFNKMATLIVLTMASSLIYSLLFFMPLCLLFGPEGRCGDLRIFCHLFSGEKIVEETPPQLIKDVPMLEKSKGNTGYIESDKDETKEPLGSL